MHLQGFRNIELAHVPLDGADVFMLGANAQGKTAFLEACGLLTALRSFRTSDLRTVIRRPGTGESRLRFEVDHEQWGDCEVEILLQSNRRMVTVDGEKVTRLQDYVGRFPVVPISSDDIELVRGSPAGRRRFLDLVLASTDAAYFEHLRAYHQLLRERNALLKQGRGGAVRAAFDQPLAVAGGALVAARRKAVVEFEADLRALNAVYAPEAESIALRYRPQLDREDPAEYRAALEAALPRDTVLGATSPGPHRDDLSILLGERAAREYGSEGQQRGLVLALKLAAFRQFRRRLGIVPVVLADDVLNELDGERKRLFWETLEAEVQVVASGTQRPVGERPAGWRICEVREGAFTAGEGAP